MIDVAARVEHIEREAADPATAVILLDVVLGYGCIPTRLPSWARPASRHAGAAGARAW